MFLYTLASPFSFSAALIPSSISSPLLRATRPASIARMALTSGFLSPGPKSLPTRGGLSKSNLHPFIAFSLPSYNADREKALLFTLIVPHSSSVKSFCVVWKCLLVSRHALLDPQADCSPIFLYCPVRITYEIVDEGDTLVWTLPSDGTRLLKKYKITIIMRIGKNVPSGTVIPLYLSVPFEWEQELGVVVK